MLKPCSKCGGVKPPGHGLRLCDKCARRPDVNSPRSPGRGCQRCGASKSAGRGVKLCDDCRELGRWRRQAKRRAATAKQRKPCRGCGKTRGAIGRGAYCQACKRQREHPPTCARCGAPKPAGAGRRLCDQCPAIRERKPCVVCGGLKEPGAGKRLCKQCSTPAATRARRTALQRLDHHLRGARITHRATVLPYRPLGGRDVAMVNATMFLEWYDSWRARRAALEQYQGRDLASVEEICVLSGFSPKRLSDARKFGRIDYAKAEAFLVNAGCQEPWRLLQEPLETEAA